MADFFHRITLERMCRFSTLNNFLAKHPEGSNQTVSSATGKFPHKYAHAYQYADNYGGRSCLNIWNPSGDFTLTQQWYTAGQYADSSLQTLECGSLHYPHMN